MGTRPDIVYVVSRLSKNSDRPERWSIKGTGSRLFATKGNVILQASIIKQCSSMQSFQFRLCRWHQRPAVNTRNHRYVQWHSCDIYSERRRKALRLTLLNGMCALTMPSRKDSGLYIAGGDGVKQLKAKTISADNQISSSTLTRSAVLRAANISDCNFMT